MCLTNLFLQLSALRVVTGGFELVPELFSLRIPLASAPEFPVSFPHNLSS
jgi:hypothetical protein